MPDYNLPDGFDPNADFSSGQGENPDSLEHIASVMGWDSWADVLAPDGGFDPDDVRPGIYLYPEDAIQDAWDRGALIDFISLWYDGEHWHLVVDYEE